ncbi:MAG: hypothetical protein COV96_01010 [Candidatus Zambryskibacteria bacterium CG11_big_fil_rev_8_21_14_0_20_42_18]|uniref:Uncharacterized protein n=1 Tax=Candidatus Zambryskibacteria bacterium CG_4_9_14_3_um_filter_42_15 TaxID=1975112 RepID=A0A2M7WSL9_9BACT|nr:MAG: hypothetical protein COV96_01010 [Candidatus Zambryskibacteria bacterium CG11_big_fil_rev_8_21_14_0_20_42_18]PJA32974.1 MAG: hypothetical protein CO185_00905 [Candidatus Zambryskibacteria bacterium CG_4_9_14_3_um_filter_42_15]
MKKVLIISISTLLVALIIFSAWYFFIREGAETTTLNPTGDGLPFGSDDSVNSGGDTTTDNFTPPELGGARQPTTDELFGVDGMPALDEYGLLTSKSNLFRISNTPVAGFVTFIKNGRLTVRYVDRATGHIYDALMPASTSSLPFEKIKVTNNTLPKVYEAYFKPDGNTVLLRLLKEDSDTVENLSLALTPPKVASGETLYTASSTALRGDMGAITVLSNNLFFVLQDTLSIVSYTFNGSGTKTLFTSAFTDWRLTPAGNNLVVYTKASDDALGYAYTLNASGGSLTKILGPLNGLTIISNTSGSKIMYSYVNGNTRGLFIKDIKGTDVLEMSPSTFAEKCLWGIKSVEKVFCGAPETPLVRGDLDGWYRGTKHLSDRIWLFDTKTETAQILSEPNKDLEIDIDFYMPKLSPNEDYLFFINKTDLSLWALKLE